MDDWPPPSYLDVSSAAPANPAGRDLVSSCDTHHAAPQDAPEGINVGLIWDLIQQGQIGNAQQRAETLEQRVHNLEVELRRTNDVVLRLLHALEHRFGQDLDGDNRIG
jgi:hypothetical protein